MSFLRSEPMCHGTLVLPADRARYFIELLGMTTNIQYIDMNSRLMTRQYQKYLQRIEDMELILRFLNEQIKVLPGTSVEPANVEKFLEINTQYQLDSIEETLQNLYTQFSKFRENNMDLIKQKNIAVENRAVLEKAAESFLALNRTADNENKSYLGGSDISYSSYFTIAGALQAEDQIRFSRAVIRVARGNAVILFSNISEDILDMTTMKPVSKVVFLIYYLCTSNSTNPNSLTMKINRIISAFRASVYEWPKSLYEAKQELLYLEEVIVDKSKALAAYENYFALEVQALLEVKSNSGGSLIEDYRLFCLKEKAIYAALNLFEGEEVTLRANCWFLESEESKIRQILTEARKDDQALAFLLTDDSKTVKLVPPTHNKTIAITEPFQRLLDTYGIPRYREINPAVFTVVTFPFIYGIMFGDIGHGLIVFVFSIYLILNSKKWVNTKDEIASMLVGSRYLILLMGIFSIYSGFLYNDFFSLGLNLFQTRYLPGPSDGRFITYRFDVTRNPYPFGFDPIWKGATNELQFTNSFKMKLSVIVGFFQMTGGLLLKGINNLYFKDYITFAFVFIPQLLFLLCFLGFMNLIIFIKWITPIGYINGKSNKPLVITNIVELCLHQKPALVAFQGQETLQNVCLLIMFLTIPSMLFVVPFVSLHKNKQKVKKNVNDIEDFQNEVADHEEYNFWEHFIHQVVDTIEYVLGAVSNTASYLRLWALSLAHQQLSLVIFNMTIKAVLASETTIIVNGIMLFFVFAFFAAATFGVMICIDSMECFLHALRLHWVEFQNKFYYADGVAFQPFVLKKILKFSQE